MRGQGTSDNRGDAREANEPSRDAGNVSRVSPIPAVESTGRGTASDPAPNFDPFPVGVRDWLIGSGGVAGAPCGDDSGESREPSHGADESGVGADEGSTQGTRKTDQTGKGDDRPTRPTRPGATMEVLSGEEGAHRGGGGEKGDEPGGPTADASVTAVDKEEELWEAIKASGRTKRAQDDQELSAAWAQTRPWFAETVV